MASNYQQAIAADRAAQANWMAYGAPLLQQVDSAQPAYSAGTTPPTIVNLRGSPTGLVTRFLIEVTGTLNCAAAHTLTRMKTGGIANLFSNIQYTDPNTLQRINTSGLHVILDAIQRGRRPVREALAPTADPFGMGQNFNAQWSPASVAGGTPQNFHVVYEINLISEPGTLNGAVWANTNDSKNLFALTLNPNFFGFGNAGAADISGSAYATDAALGTTLPTLTNLSVVLYQDMLVWQPPPGVNAPLVLPNMALAHAYRLSLVPALSIKANTRNELPLATQRSVLGQTLFWDNFGYVGLPGTDVTNIELKIANSVQVGIYTPNLLATRVRDEIGCDMPVGSASGGATTDWSVHYFGSRRNPINVASGGNISLYFNPNTVQAGANLNIGYAWDEITASTMAVASFMG
jgi:hypothetical protein